MSLNNAWGHNSQRTSGLTFIFALFSWFWVTGCASVTGNTAPPAKGQLSASPSSAAFGNVNVGSSSTQTVTLSNSGATTLTVSQTSVTGSGFSISGLTVPFALAPGQSDTLTARFAPTVAGSVSGSVSLVSDGSNSPTAIALAGTGVTSSPQLSVSPTSSISFGNVVVGTTNTQTITLANSGSASLTLSQATVSGVGFSISGLTLPLTLAAAQSSTFSVRFTPAATGSVTGSISLVSNAPGSPTTIALSGTGVQPQPLQITTASLPSGEMGSNYTATLTASGGTTPYAWSVASGSLPPGLNLSASGTLTGTPTSSGQYSFTVQVRDSAASPQTATATFTVSIAPPPLQITTAQLPGGTVGTAYSATLAATGGVPPYTWSLVSGSLPTGLALQAAGTISGTPTLAGAFTFIVQVQDTTVQSSSRTFSINIATSPPAATILWSADMEAGNLDEWSLGSGGGEYNSGGGDSVASQDVAHSGTWSAKMTINAPTSISAGTRLFRWREPQTYNDLYYSAWFYFPQTYTYSLWSNYFQWKSKLPTGQNDPFLYLVAATRANGNMHFVIHWWNGLTIEGPHLGEFGFRVYSQALMDIPVGQWFHIEAHYVCAGDFTGRLTVWQDGVQLFDLTGIRTRYPTGDCQWSANNYGAGINPNPVVVYVDDAVISTGPMHATKPSPMAQVTGPADTRSTQPAQQPIRAALPAQRRTSLSMPGIALSLHQP